MTRRDWFRIGLGLCIAAVSVLAFAPLDQPPGMASDKANHVVAFFVLAWLTAGACTARRWVRVRWGLLLGYGLFIETVQHFLPHRDASAMDLLADGLGILAYVALAAGLASIRGAQAEQG